MEKLIETFLNGNLTDAKKKALRYNAQSIREHLRDRGWSFEKATLAAEFLKGYGSFQAYCDAT